MRAPLGRADLCQASGSGARGSGRAHPKAARASNPGSTDPLVHRYLRDLIWIGVVLRAAKNVKETPVRPQIAQEARSACGELRHIGKARKRSRRPTGDELARLRQHFERAATGAPGSRCARSLTSRSPRPDARRRSAGWNGWTMMPRLVLALCATRSTPPQGKATTVASATPPRPGQSSSPNREPAHTYFL